MSPIRPWPPRWESAAFDPRLDDRGDCWLLWTPSGIALPIPKAALGDAEREALLRAFPR